MSPPFRQRTSAQHSSRLYKMARAHHLLDPRHLAQSRLSRQRHHCRLRLPAGRHSAVAMADMLVWEPPWLVPARGDEVLKVRSHLSRKPWTEMISPATSCNSWPSNFQVRPRENVVVQRQTLRVKQSSWQTSITFCITTAFIIHRVTHFISSYQSAMALLHFHIAFSRLLFSSHTFINTYLLMIIFIISGNIRIERFSGNKIV